jgi:iron complex transport system substrate-binding protein
MRIVSLVPSATEMLFALGLGPDLVAVTHECDYPSAALELPKITRDVLPRGLSAAEIDAAVRERTLAGQSIYELDEDLLRDLRPELIVTQALCSVCAVSFDDVRAVAEEIDTQPQVIALDPHTVGEVLGRSRRRRTERTRRSRWCARARHGSTGSGLRFGAPGVHGSRRSSGSIPRSPPATGCRS